MQLAMYGHGDSLSWHTVMWASQKGKSVNVQTAYLLEKSLNLYSEWVSHLHWIHYNKFNLKLLTLVVHIVLNE